MLARAHTITITGLRAHHVTVDVEVREGLPTFLVLGLSRHATLPARERVRAAIGNSGLRLPRRRVTASLAPARERPGSEVELALACAVLAASGQLPAAALARHVLIGELSLAGEILAVPDIGALAAAAGDLALGPLLLARPSVPDAGVEGCPELIGLDTLAAAVTVLRRSSLPPPGRRDGSPGRARR